MDNLKPCPFCGGSDIYETYSQEYALGTKNPEIFCNSCKIIFAIEDDSPYMNCDEDYVYRKAKTVEAWNRRKEGRWIDMDDHVMCSCCGATHYGADKNYCPNCGADMRKETEDG